MFCLFFEGSPCYDDVNTLVACRMNMAELSHNDLDMIVMGHLQQLRANSSSTMKTKHHSAKDRTRASMKYCLFGKQVCRNTFLFAFNMGIKQYKNLCKHYDENGFVPPVHGNVGKRPSNSYSVEDEKKAVDFIKNFADIHAMPLPGRMPRMKDYTVMMLPSDVTKHNIWKSYVTSCVESASNPVSLTKFKEIWNMYLPQISVMKIASDLCVTCQNNNNLIMKSVNCTEEEKSERLREQEVHLNQAKECRQYYRKQCDASSAYINSLTPEQKESDELDGPVHVSFDYAQNLFYPHSAQQVGPIYFKTPRKCIVFGVCCEAYPQQVNYLIDESECTGKGPNETISYLHHYLSNHALKSKRYLFHCDNCRGQNKNNYVMQYMSWRTLVGLNTDVEVSFMVPYHTWFAPYWCFGLMKLKYRRSNLSTLSDVANCVATSTRQGKAWHPLAGGQS